MVEAEAQTKVLVQVLDKQLAQLSPTLLSRSLSRLLARLAQRAPLSSSPHCSHFSFDKQFGVWQAELRCAQTRLARLQFHYDINPFVFVAAFFLL